MKAATGKLTASKDRHVGLSLLVAAALAFFGCNNGGGGGEPPSSSSVVEVYAFCVFFEYQACTSGSFTSCTSGGVLSQTCPYNSSSSSSAGSLTESSSSLVSSSSSIEPSSSSLAPSSSSIEPSSSSLVPSSSSVAPSSSSLVPSSSSIAPSSSSIAPSSSSIAPSSSSIAPSSSSIAPSSSSIVPSSSSLVPSSSSVEPSSSSLAPSSSSIEPSSSSLVPSSSSSAGSLTESSSSVEIVYGEPVEYEGETYETVVIGTQTWFARNLNYNAAGSKCGNGLNLSDANTLTCDTYGRLYNWASAMALPSSCNSSTCASQISTKHQGVCPTGWHISSDTEWSILLNYVDGTGGSTKRSSPTAGTKLKAITGWNSSSGVPNGTDDFGFAALPGGSGLNGIFRDAGNYGLWWSATEDYDKYSYRLYMNYAAEYANWGSWDRGQNWFSIRCLKD